MDNRILAGAAILSAVALAVVLFVPTNERPPTARTGSELLSLNEQSGIDQVIIQKGDGSIELNKQKSGRWLIAADGFPVSGQRLATLFRQLAEAKIRTAMPQVSDSDAEYGLGKKSYISLGSDGTTSKTIEVGDSRSGGGVFVRLDKKDTVYLIGQRLEVNTATEYWELKALAKLPKAAVKDLEVQSPDEKQVIKLSREKPQADFLVSGENEKASAAYDVDSLVTLAENLTYVERVAAEDAAAQSALKKPVTLKITTFDGDILQLELGRAGKGESERVMMGIEVEGEGEVAGLPVDLLQEIGSTWRFEVPKQILEHIKLSKAAYKQN